MLALIIVGTSLAFAFFGKAYQSTYVQRAVKNWYYPVETGFQEQLARRVPHEFNRGRFFGDISPLNPIPYVNRNPDVGRIVETNWGFTWTAKENQLKLIDERFNKEETHPKLWTMFKNPIGKQAWRRSSLKY
jgi:hypothetical protein